MIRTITFDDARKFQLIYGGLTAGYVVSAKQGTIPFDRTRKHAKILRKFKKISTGEKDSPERKLMEPYPQIVKLDEDELQLLKELYEKVDWNATVTDEVVDALDFLMGSPQGDED